jgi:hypothetical protein
MLDTGASWIQPVSSRPIFLENTLLQSSQLYLGLLSDLFHSDETTKQPYAGYLTN